MSTTDADPAPRFRHHLEFLGMEATARIARHLPYSWLRPLARMAGGLVYQFDARGRATALENLRCAFGARYSMAERHRIARASYATFARTMLELFWAPNLTPEILERLIEPIGNRDLRSLSANGRPVIYFCLHASNFEWLSLWTGVFAGPSLVLTQHLRNRRLVPIIDRLRSATGHTIIPRDRAAIRMMKHLRRGGRINMLNDLNIDPKQGGVAIEMFGMKTSATSIHAALALKTQALLIPAVALPLADGRYQFDYQAPVEYDPGETPAVVAQRCWDRLEPSIHKHPELWLWPYKHWRYKPSGPESDRYPAYANTAKRFDKLLAGG